MAKVALFSEIGPPQSNVVVHARFAVGPFACSFLSLAARPKASATQVLQPALHADQDLFPSNPNPRVDYVPPGRPDKWTAAERRKFREANSERLSQSQYGKSILDWTLAELLARRTTEGTYRATKEAQREKERAICFARWAGMTETEIRRYSECATAARIVWDELAYEEADPENNKKGRSFGELVERVGRYRRDFLEALHAQG